MNKKSIAQTMKDAGFKPLSRAQQQQNIATLTPVWIEEQNDMTTKTDEARECAEEIVDLFDLNCKLGEHGPRHNIMVDEVETIKNILAKHFPPSVPVVQPEKLEHVHILAKQVLITGDPQELPESADDNDPRQHNCDAMGCPTLDHILYRLPFTDHREPIDIKAFAKTLAECIDFTAGPVQARELFEKKLKALIAGAK